MRALRARVSVSSRPVDVYRVLTDFKSYQHWNPWLKNVEGEAREGTVVSVQPDHLALLGSNLHYQLEKIQPQDFVRWRQRAWFGFLFHTLRESAVYMRQGGTAIYSVRLSFHGLLAPVVGRLYGRVVREGLLREAQALKHYCETRHYLAPAGRAVSSPDSEFPNLDEIVILDQED